jgi:uncharacterized protein (DUF2141 family)
MRFTLVLLAGGFLVAAAHAQDKGPPIEMLPVPKTLPSFLFWPEPLSGTMLRPLSEPESGGTVDTPADAASAEPPADAPTQSGAESPESEAAALAGTPAETPPGPAESAEASPEAVAPPGPAPATGPAESAAVPPEVPEAPPASEKTTVHIIVENVESSSGRVNVAVCDKSLSEEGCPYHTSVPASAGFVEAELAVPPGRYAVVGYHDVNSNDQFDKFLGVPREPYALSGKAAESLVPDFNDAALKINQGANYVIIRMKRLGSG